MTGPPRDPSSKRSAAREKRARRRNTGVYSNPRPWRCLHLECLTVERVILNTGRRPRTVPSPYEILAAAEELRALHPELDFPLRAAVAWRFGISVHEAHRLLRLARRKFL